MGDSGIVRRIDEGPDGCGDDGEDEFGWYLPRQRPRARPESHPLGVGSQPPNIPFRLQGVQKADAGLDLDRTAEGA